MDANLTVTFQVQGFDTSLTLSNGSGRDLLKALPAVLAQLAELGATPTMAQAASQPAQASQQDGGNDPAWCTVHNCAMKARKGKNGDTWYSHHHDGEWCRGR